MAPSNIKPCTRGCGAQIYFDPSNPISHPSADKWIPIDAATNEAHKCPNFKPSAVSEGNVVQAQTQAQGPPVATQKAIDVKVIPEGLVQRLERIEYKIDQILSHLKVNDQLAEAELQYDTDREVDGTLGTDKW